MLRNTTYGLYNMFRRHHLSFHWREQVLYDSNGKMKYKPDVMGIMEDYYRSCIIGHWLEERCPEITKADILGTKTEDAKRDMDNIRGMCEVDVMCQMYQDLLEEYYMKFSFDLLSNERLSTPIMGIIGSIMKQLFYE